MLLEVVLALSLFVLAATVITGGLNASVREAERLRLNLHASNLAISLLAELQMGVKPVEAAGPEPFEAPFEMWTWQIETSPIDDDSEAGLPLRNVEVIVRHLNRPIVRRLTQFLVPPPVEAAASVGTNRPPATRQDRLAPKAPF
ncbi:MAG: hypothetical protein HYY23_02160 [Verrucomicrobia bacterium]|nr:hypothetical protein [Verrucomicrobiota bacterium]